MNLEIPTRFAERDWERAVDGGPLRFAVVGLGWFGRDVALPAIEDSDYCEATAVVSGSAEKASSVAEERGLDAAFTYEEYADGEHADEYDAVYVVTPNALHLPHVETAASLGKDVLCEKPLEATAERAERVVGVCEDAGVRLMTAYRMQTTRSVRWVREQVRAGVIGDPVQFTGEFSFNMLAGGGDPDQWRLDPDLAGGGALMDIGVYPLNTARFVLDADPVAVHATATESPPEFDGVDVARRVHAGVPRRRHRLLYRQLRGERREPHDCRGDRGTHHRRPGVRRGRRPADNHRARPRRDDCRRRRTPEMVEEFDFFATAVLGERDIGPDGRHGHFDLRLTEAIYESSDEGRRVDL